MKKLKGGRSDDQNKSPDRSRGCAVARLKAIFFANSLQFRFCEFSSSNSLWMVMSPCTLTTPSIYIRYLHTSRLDISTGALVLIKVRHSLIGYPLVIR